MTGRRAMPADFKDHFLEMTLRDLCAYYRAGAEVVRRWTEEAGGKEPKGRYVAPVRTIPDDFAEYASRETQLQLIKRYRCGPKMVTRWRRQTGILPPKRRSQAEQPPQGFKLTAPTLTVTELQVRYARSEATIRRWCRELGVSAKRPPQSSSGSANHRFSPAPPLVRRDETLAGRAAEYLRRFGPVVRCNHLGNYDPRGIHWRRGSTILTAAEIVERAKRNGWNPDAWKMVA